MRRRHGSSCAPSLGGAHWTHASRSVPQFVEKSVAFRRLGSREWVHRNYEKPERDTFVVLPPIPENWHTFSKQGWAFPRARNPRRTRSHWGRWQKSIGVHENQQRPRDVTFQRCPAAINGAEEVRHVSLLTKRGKGNCRIITRSGESPRGNLPDTTRPSADERYRFPPPGTSKPQNRIPRPQRVSRLAARPAGLPFVARRAPACKYYYLPMVNLAILPWRWAPILACPPEKEAQAGQQGIKALLIVKSSDSTEWHGGC